MSDKIERTTVTIYEVAEAAGVNPSTVSRALNNPGRVNQRTEEKIRAIAKKLNYQVNPFARALPTGKTKMLGLMVADITNPVYFGSVRGIEAEALKHGYTLVIAESQESTGFEEQALTRIESAVDGIIMVTSRLSDEEIQELSARKPLVLMNRHCPGVADIVPNIEPGIESLISHLQSLGHKNVVYISGPTNSWMSRERWRVLMKYAVAANMKIVEIASSAPSLAGGKESVDRIIASGASAVIAYNDMMAIGILMEMTSRGISIPEEVSLSGFDNIFGSDFTSPPLTTIEAPLEALGRRAINQILGIDDVEDDQELSTTLIIRSSTGKARQ
jgi:LacI family transcriptional regulator